MTASSFDRALALVLAHEGGYVDHPDDPGGPTNLGVTIGTLSAALGRPATRAEVRALTPVSVAPLYRSRYWDVVRGDDLPAGLDYAAFDWAVNSGPARAAIALQRLVGVADDGHIGPLTLKAVGGQDRQKLIGSLCDARIAFLRALSTWPSFGKGWTSRVAGVRKVALGMIAAPPAVPTCPSCGKPLAA
ncbi:glycoside hydrolase family 108 protein [Methylobacterium sp. ID0610]|uniref:glycoside hydrolase family 108 protein n=1 Tax=Methylobacterium carpenticola TaxID=3344827 RepID=UPI0036C10724